MLQSIFCLQLNNARVSLLLTPKLLYTLKPYIKKMGKFNKELPVFVEVPGRVELPYTVLQTVT